MERGNLERVRAEPHPFIRKQWECSVRSAHAAGATVAAVTANAANAAATAPLNTTVTV